MTNNDDLAQELEQTAVKANEDACFNMSVHTQQIFSPLAERDADKKRIAELSAHLGNAHAFIENTEAFGREAATGIIKCGDAEWNIDNSKAAPSEGGIKLEVGE